MGKAATAAAAKPAKEISVASILKADTHYSVLKLKPTQLKKQPKEKVTAAFKKACLRVHPDKVNHPRAAEAFVRLREAYKVLADPALRQAYEDELHTAKLKEDFEKDLQSKSTVAAQDAQQEAQFKQFREALERERKQEREAEEAQQREEALREKQRAADHSKKEAQKQKEVRVSWRPLDVEWSV